MNDVHAKMGQLKSSNLSSNWCGLVFCIQMIV